jgi:hypothetical protein
MLGCVVEGSLTFAESRFILSKFRTSSGQSSFLGRVSGYASAADAVVLDSFRSLVADSVILSAAHE